MKGFVSDAGDILLDDDLRQLGDRPVDDAPLTVGTLSGAMAANLGGSASAAPALTDQNRALMRDPLQDSYEIIVRFH